MELSETVQEGLKGESSRCLPAFAKSDDLKALHQQASHIPEYRCNFQFEEDKVSGRVAIGGSLEGNHKTFLGYLASIIKSCTNKTTHFKGFQESVLVISDTQERSNIARDLGPEATREQIQVEVNLRSLAWIILNRFAIASGASKLGYREFILAYLDSKLDPELTKWLDRFRPEFLLSWSIDAERDYVEPECKPQDFLIPILKVLRTWDPKAVKRMLRESVAELNALKRNNFQVMLFRDIEKSLMTEHYVRLCEKVLAEKVVGNSVEPRELLLFKTYGTRAEFKSKTNQGTDLQSMNAGLIQLLSTRRKDLDEPRQNLRASLIDTLSCLPLEGYGELNANQKARLLLADPFHAIPGNPTLAESARDAYIDQILGYAMSHSKELVEFLAPKGNPDQLQQRRRVIKDVLGQYCADLTRRDKLRLQSKHEDIYGKQKQEDSSSFDPEALLSKAELPPLSQTAFKILFAACDHTLYEYPILYSGSQNKSFNGIVYPGKVPAVAESRFALFGVPQQFGIFTVATPTRVTEEKTSPKKANGLKQKKNGHVSPKPEKDARKRVEREEAGTDEINQALLIQLVGSFGGAVTQLQMVGLNKADYERIKLSIEGAIRMMQNIVMCKDPASLSTENEALFKQVAAILLSNNGIENKERRPSAEEITCSGPTGRAGMGTGMN